MPALSEYVFITLYKIWVDNFVVCYSLSGYEEGFLYEDELTILKGAAI